MNIRRAILAIALTAGIVPAFAQVPAPVPALPDTERRTTYSISATTCACSVGFALYGDSTDYANWVEVFLNGVRVNFNDPTLGWTITSPSGSLSTLARPITDAVLTFNAAQTGTVQIVGARRPRRTSQFSENAGVPARNVNQVVTDITATLREMWDKNNDMTGRGLFSQPGVTLGGLPLPAACKSSFLGFDSTGLNPICAAIGTTGTATFPGSSGSGDLVVFNDTTGKSFADLPKLSLPVFVGDSGAGGVVGYVPAPAAGDNTAGKVLGAGGGWKSLNYTAPWTGAVAYPQGTLNTNAAVYMTDFMGTSTCDGTNFVGGTGGVSSTTLTVASVTSGTLKVGHTIGGTGITAGTTIASLGTGTGGAGTYILSAPMTIAAGTVIQGGTDQAANMQAFLTQISVNGVAGNKSVTGIFAPGNCFVSASPTLTLNSVTIVQQYHLLGYGSTITPDPSRALDGLFVSRGTFATHADEQTSVFVEGLTINARNNANIVWGIEVNYPRTWLLRNQIYGGDDGTTHNQTNFAGIYFHQKTATDDTTGPFWSRIIGNVIKGTGTGTSGIPIGVRLDGDVNALVIAQNTFLQGTYGIRVFNSCATVNATCAEMPDGVAVTGNDFEALTNGIIFTTSVPSLSAIAGWHIFGNRIEAISQGVVDISSITQQSLFPMILGPNMQIGSFTYLFNNATPIAVTMMDKVQIQTVINPASLAATATAILGTVATTGAATTMPCKASAVGDLLGTVVTCYVSSLNNVTFRLSNPTSGAIDLPSMTFVGEVVQNY